VEGRTGYVVEGFFDVIGLWQSGYRNAVAIMGSYPSKHQVEKMTKFFTNIVIVPDGDNAGRDMALKVMEAVKPFLPVHMVDMPSGKDPADLSPSELADRLGPPDHAPV
jgi:DNA primase